MQKHQWLAKKTLIKGATMLHFRCRKCGDLKLKNGVSAGPCPGKRRVAVPALIINSGFAATREA